MSSADTPAAAGGLPSDAGQGGALAEDAPVARAGVQDAPAQDQNVPTDEDRIAGVVAQTRADVGDAGVERLADVLRQRFEEAGLDVDAERTRALAAEIDAH